MRVLAGDIGGTNARFALVDVTDATARIVHERRYPSGSAPGLAPLVRRYLDEAGTSPERACYGIAGPVVDGECRTPNLPWTVSERTLAADSGIPHTTIINDFDAAGYGVGRLGPADLVTLQAGTAADHGTIALIGAGTGLGEGFLTWDGARYRVHASEGGHVNFAARDDVEWGLGARCSTNSGACRTSASSRAQGSRAPTATWPPPSSPPSGPRSTGRWRATIPPRW